MARERAIEYLETAPVAIAGAGGNDTSYRVAARIKDIGVTPAVAVDVLLEYWNPNCQPPWSVEEIQTFVDNAFRYGQEPPGAGAPEVQFAPVAPPADTAAAHPFDEINRTYAFVVTGNGHQILHETTAADGSFMLRYRPESSFHAELSSRRMTLANGKDAPTTRLWIASPRRRSYRGVCFLPGRPAPEGWYNLWRGFAVTPKAKGHAPTGRDKEALDSFLEHTRENVCRGDDTLYRWLLGFFAQLVQRPWDKPLVALVFKGPKGVGKNALVDRVGALLGPHYLLASSKRYLSDHFNGHLENLLLFALDEAFWSGDKQVEGTLKDLITGTSHLIERKNQEPYRVDNRLRLVIIGNEDWQVPASHDERRFAVFDVGAGRQKDKAFFIKMREDMEAGGYSALLRFLLDYDLSGIDVNDAPATSGLLDQKLHTLDPLQAWWFDCLHEGCVLGSEFGNAWPKTISKTGLRDAIRRYMRERNIRVRFPTDVWIGRMMKQMCPGLGAHREKGEAVYGMPEVETARSQFSAYIGHADMWK